MSLLIITSTVNVNSNLTFLVDPEVRLQQYVLSVLFYIKTKYIESIVICDNSGFDYSSIKSLLESAEIHNKKIEFLSFASDSNKTMKYGKGYGEGEIMSFIVNNSVLYKNEKHSFYKVTGRIIVSNVDTIIKFTPVKKNFFQRTRFNSVVNEEKMDTRFYQLKKDEFEKYFLDSYKDVNDTEGFYLEHCFYKSIMKNKIKFSFFNILPLITGISGSSGASYNIPKKNFIIRSFLNLFLNILNIK